VLSLLYFFHFPPRRSLWFAPAAVTMAGARAPRLQLPPLLLLLLPLLLLLAAGMVATVTSSAPPHTTPALRATWLTVYMNHNQSYCPGPDGNAPNQIRCYFEEALERYNITFPAGSGMTLENPHSVDWVGGNNSGNIFVYLSLIRRAGVDVVIPDFTNGFSNSNSRFPVEMLHAALAEYFPSMNVSYAVSATSFAPAKQYLLNTTGADTFGYLFRDGKPVFVVYAVYDDFVRLRCVSCSVQGGELARRAAIV
jgi:hypothetical protein